MIEKKDFLALGWGNDEQSNSIYNFLADASREISSDAYIIDIGAGQCRFKPFFNHCHYIAVDNKCGDENWDYSKLDVIDDVVHLKKIKDETFDYALCTTVLEHIDDPATFFKNIARILKPNGKLFLYVPFICG